MCIKPNTYLHTHRHTLHTCEYMCVYKTTHAHAHTHGVGCAARKGEGGRVQAPLCACVSVIVYKQRDVRVYRGMYTEGCVSIQTEGCIQRDVRVYRQRDVRVIL